MTGLFDIFHRPRRLRQNPVLRKMVQENYLRASDLIMPLFLIEGEGRTEEISSMPGQYRYTIDRALEAIEGWLPTPNHSGVEAFLLFGIPDPKKKDSQGKIALDPEGIIPRAVTAIKSSFPNVLLITDLCFCEYTDHGHCGIINDRGELDNDATLKILTEQAILHAQAGVNLVAPSSMVDGMVGAIRPALDVAGYTGTGIMSYAVKYASAFYGPFREAVHSAPGFGDRRGYQMDPPNSQEALREAEGDVAEGADILMVKPGMPYLDILHRISDRFFLPTAVYQVSGEYAMIMAATQNGSLNKKEVVRESLTAFKRAGASFIITYFAAEIAPELPH